MPYLQINTLQLQIHRMNQIQTSAIPWHGVQRSAQPSGYQIFIINLPLLRLSKLVKFFELYIRYFSEALTVNGLYLSKSMSHNMKTLLKLDCRYKFQNLPQIRHKEQNFPPAQSRGALTFSGLCPGINYPYCFN